MASTQRAPDVSGWPTKAEAAESLHISEKSLERWSRRGQLEQRIRDEGGRRKVVVYRPEHLEKIREKLQSDASEVLPAENWQIAPVPAPNAVESPFGALAVHLAALSGMAEKWGDSVSRSVYLSAGEAVKLSGLPRQVIKNLAAAGEIKTVLVGVTRVKYRRADVEKL